MINGADLTCCLLSVCMDVPLELRRYRPVFKARPTIISLAQASVLWQTLDTNLERQQPVGLAQRGGCSSAMFSDISGAGQSSSSSSWDFSRMPLAPQELLVVADALRAGREIPYVLNSPDCGIQGKVQRCLGGLFPCLQPPICRQLRWPAVFDPETRWLALG